MIKAEELEQILTRQEEVIESHFWKEGAKGLGNCYKNKKQWYNMMRRYIRARWWIFVHLN